mgnify:CR=1 FL=1
MRVLLNIKDNVKFRLGSLDGQIIELQQYWRGTNKPRDDVIYFPRNNMTEKEMNDYVDERVEYHYTVRLPNGLLIRDLRDWELEKV